MDDDFEIDPEGTCPKCHESPIHYRTCTNIFCEDGYIDESEEDYCEPGTVVVACAECRGTGVEVWCPKCGANLSGTEAIDEEDDE